LQKIQIVRNKDDFDAVEDLIQIILKQMSAIGSEKDYYHIKNAVDNALSKSNRSVFFLYQKDFSIEAFAYGNICAGLESGADYFWINELFVSEDIRNQQIASNILSFIEDWAKTENIKYIACITSLKNSPAKKLYLKNGFELNETVWVDKTIE